jgi:hypothetical protein
MSDILNVGGSSSVRAVGVTTKGEREVVDAASSPGATGRRGSRSVLWRHCNKLPYEELLRQEKRIRKGRAVALIYLRRSPRFHLHYRSGISAANNRTVKNEFTADNPTTEQTKRGVRNRQLSGYRSRTIGTGFT